MTIIEQIKAEIERLIDERYNWVEDNSSESVAACEALTRVLSLLSTLETEKPMQEGLEEEISKKYANDTTTMRTREQYAELARYFYDLGCRRTAEKYDEIEYNRQRAEESVPNDLEEYASRVGFDYADNIVQESPGHRWNDHDVEYAYRDGIIAGAKWQKEQMMKEAVEGVVSIDVGLVSREYFNFHSYDFNPAGKFKDGDKVRIIIVKEE